MLDINKGCETAPLLGLGNRCQGEGRFARGLRPINLNDPPPWQAPNTQSPVNEQVPGGNDIDIHAILIPHPHDCSFSEFLLDRGNGEI